MTVSTAQPISYANQFIEKLPSCCQEVCEKIRTLAHYISLPFIALYHWVCPINPVTGVREFKLIPTCVEKFIGKIAYAPLVESSGGEILETDPEYGKYAKIVREVGSELVAQCARQDLEYEFKLLDAKNDNAWCLPGGKIGINLGLIQRMEKETSDYGLGWTPTLSEKVAAVLSHEITHAAARHGGRSLEFSLFLFTAIQAAKYALAYRVRHGYDQEIENAKNDPVRRAQLIHQQYQATENCLTCLSPLSSWLISGLRLCGSRSHEFEADKFGMHLLAKVQSKEFNKNSPRSAVWLMHYFQQHHSSKTGVSWFDWAKGLISSHPTPEERVEANIKTWEALNRI
jgi:predicted Zn-dependent protease